MGVFFSVTRSEKPVSHVTVYHSAKGGASGGTTETMFTMGPLPKEMRDPFLLNPEDTVSDIQRRNSSDDFSVKQHELAYQLKTFPCYKRQGI